MSKSYSQLMREMDVLKAKAESVKKRELMGVVERIKEAISFYELTAADLGLAGASAARTGAPRRAAKTAAKANGSSHAKFQDDAGNTWSGRGPRPGWFKKALAAGKTPEDFSASAGTGSAPAAKTAVARKRKGRAKPAPKYKDVSGKTWSGRGRKPGWFTQAIDAGQSADSMLI